MIADVANLHFIRDGIFSRMAETAELAEAAESSFTDYGRH